MCVVAVWIEPPLSDIVTPLSTEPEEFVTVPLIVNVPGTIAVAVKFWLGGSALLIKTVWLGGLKV